MVISIPMWKAYLYSFIRRYRTYVGILRYRLNYKKLAGFHSTIRAYYIRNGMGGIYLRQNKLKNYSDFITMIENDSSARDIEYLVAYQLLPLKPLNVGDLFMEMSKLVEFAKEVGINALKAKKMKGDELAREIIANLSEEGSYSDDLYTWYEEVTAEHPEWFEDSEESDETSLEEIIEMVENAESGEILAEIIDTYPSIFKDAKKLKKLKEDELQEKMVEILNSVASDDSPEETTEETTEENNDAMTVGELKELVKNTDDLANLKEIVASVPELKKNISVRGGFLKPETLKGNMLKYIEEHMEESEDNEESEETNSIEEEMERMKKLSITELKKEATELGLNVKTIIDKKKILVMIEEALQATISEDDEESEEMEITPAFIKECVKSKDMESLLKIAEEFNYKPNIIEKRTPGQLGDKLIILLEGIEESETEPKDEKKTGPKEGPMNTVLKMLRSGKKENEIATVVKPMLKALGKNEIAAAQRFKQMMEIAKEECK